MLAFHGPMRLLQICSSSLRGGGGHRGDLLLVFFSSSTNTTASTFSNDASSPKPHFMVEYLVSACGFSPAAAANDAKRLAHVTSTAKPDAVLAFLRSQSLDAAQIRRILSWDPRFLCSDVDTTLAPKFQAILALGFDQSEVARLFCHYPKALHLGLRSTLLPRMVFWLNLLGSTKLLMKCLTKAWLLRYSVDMFSQNLQLLRSLGIPDSRIVMALKYHPSVIIRAPDKFRALVDRVEACGIPLSSGSFLWGIVILHDRAEAGFRAKREVMMNLGWSEEQFLATFRRAPIILTVSEELMRRKVEFLKEHAGCSTADLVRAPVLLMLSLDKRMIPRYGIIEMLKSRGINIGGPSVVTVMMLSEAKFMERFILRHKHQAPELLDMYTSQCGRDRSSNTRWKKQD